MTEIGNLGTLFPNFVFMIIVIKKLYFWGMKPKYCIDHKKDYYVNIYKNPVSKICDHHNCKKTAIYNFWGMKPRYCFDHKDKLHVNIPKKHKLCYKHYITFT